MNDAEYRARWAESTDVPYGLCWCGCGGKTDIAARSRSDRGLCGGEPIRFITGHQNRLAVADQDAEVCRRYQANEKISNICEDLDIDHSTVYAALRRNGIEAGRNAKSAAWATEKQKEEICRRYLAGEGSYALAEEFGVHGGNLGKMLNKRGITRRSASEVRRTHSCDHSFFDEIDSEAKAYWLGFLAADGCVVEHARKSFVVRLALASKDRNHLLKYRSDIQSTHAIVDYITKSGHGGNHLAIASPELAEGLAKHGVSPRKTFTHKWPDFLPDDLLHHYLRGYFDGDGCFYARVAPDKAPVLSWGIVGSEAFCLGAQRYLIGAIRVGKTKLYIPKNSPNIRKLNYTGSRQVSRIFHFMYDGATIWLPRKRDKVTPYIL